MDVKRIAGPVLGALLLAGVAGAIYKSSNKSAKQARDEAKAAARDILARLPVATKVILALENEAMIIAGGRLIASGRLDGLVIGTSYLSESSKIYDQMGLEKYRLLMRGLGKKAASSGVRPYTTSNYCTFETSGIGDKNKAFVAEQVDFVSSQGAWGSLTRFYSHLDVAQKAREASEHARSRP